MINFMDVSKDEIFKNECENTISKVQRLLNENDEWIERFDVYAEKISGNLLNIASKKKKFNEWAPLYLYMNAGNAKKSMIFSLRYLGQDVAALNVVDDLIKINTSKFDKTIKSNFKCNIELKNSEWKSAEAANFRRYFSGNPSRDNSQKNNDEHRVESLLLTEFSKNSSKDKILCNIQPVKLAGIVRFPMTTPLSANNMLKLKYSGSAGGNIDILTRIGTGKATKLCIMELKDENVKKEPPAKAAQQGLAYAVFVRELLRSKSGGVWWKIFGFEGKLPEKIELYIACVMPFSDDSSSFSSNIIYSGNDSFHLHYLYFKETDNKITEILTSLKQCISKNMTHSYSNG